MAPLRQVEDRRPCARATRGAYEWPHQRSPTLARTSAIDQRSRVPTRSAGSPRFSMDSLTALDFDQAGRILPSGRTLVMGILNVTPDSFSDSGKFTATGRAIE